jgi:hypothetical protein
MGWHMQDADLREETAEMPGPRPYLARTMFMAAMIPALAACATGAQSPVGTSTPPAAATGVPSASTAPSPWGTPSPITFVSTRHAYSVEVPSGWFVNEYEGTWTSLEQFNPAAEVPGEDAITVLGFDSFLVVNAMAIPDGMTAADWLTAFDARVAAGVSPDCPVSTSEGTVAGEPATIGEQACDGSILIGRSLTHAGRGYYFTTRHAADDAAAKAILEQIVASIRFTGD